MNTVANKNKKQWPKLPDLEKWWVFHKMESIPKEQITPELIGEWINDVYRDGTKLNNFHKILWEQYEEFRDQYEHYSN